MGDELIQSWPDGHALLRDRWQRIVKHPRSCKNASRGSNAYARETYFTNETYCEAELRTCHLVLSQA